MVLEVRALLEHTVDRRIRLNQDLQAKPSITLGDPTQIQNALLNIGINARDAMPQGGEITFSTRIVELDEKFITRHAENVAPGKYIEIAISDNGTGMSDEVKAHLFEPFFTTKPEGKGTGMGLAAVYGTVKSHRGAINVYSEFGKGTTFKIYLPLAEGDEALVKEAAPVVSAKSAGTVLIIDDEEVVREIAAAMLKSLGYYVRICRNGQEGVELYRQNWQEINVVLLDMVMPELSGYDTFIELYKINPNVRVVLSSGFSLNRSVQEIIDRGARSFLQKPFLLSDLARKVADAMKE